MEYGIAKSFSKAWCIACLQFLIMNFEELIKVEYNWLLGPEALSCGWSIVAEQSNNIRNNLIAIFGYIGEYYIYKQMEISQTHPMDIISFMINSSLKWRRKMWILDKRG